MCLYSLVVHVVYIPLLIDDDPIFGLFVTLLIPSELVPVGCIHKFKQRIVACDIILLYVTESLAKFFAIVYQSQMFAKLMFYWHENVNNMFLLCRFISTKLTCDIRSVNVITQSNFWRHDKIRKKS